MCVCVCVCSLPGLSSHLGTDSGEQNLGSWPPGVQRKTCWLSEHQRGWFDSTSKTVRLIPELKSPKHGQRVPTPSAQRLILLWTR